MSAHARDIHRPGPVLKPAVPREVRFYERELQNVEPLRPFVPVFHGTVEPPPEVQVMVKDSRVTQYIAMDNLTHGYSKPCVLDLKMGTRQHGHDASPKKVATMTAKCKATTSACMGFRLCGMKVYNVTTQSYAYRDKYFGRRVKPHEVMEALEMFFHNGNSVQADMIPMILQEVYGLIKVVQKCSTHRFFSASLLLIYEGDVRMDRRVTVKLIDFAHTTSTAEIVQGATEGGPSVEGDSSAKAKQAGSPLRGFPFEGPDTGLLRGLHSIAEVLEQIMMRCYVLEARSATAVFKMSSFDVGLGESPADAPPVHAPH